MASLTYVCFVPAQGLIRDLSANLSNTAFKFPLASKWWWQSIRGLPGADVEASIWLVRDFRQKSQPGPSRRLNSIEVKPYEVRTETKLAFRVVESLFRFVSLCTEFVSSTPQINTRAKRRRMRKVSIFKIAVANVNFTTTTPFFELKSNFISIQNFKAGNV